MDGNAISAIVVCVIGSLIIGTIGRNRKIGFGWSFVVSLFLSPIIGLIIVLCSKKNSDREYIDVEKKGNA